MAVILQGHLDMVCEKTPACTKDMEREGLDLAVDGDYVYAVAPPWAETTESRLPWPWQCWMMTAFPIPGWRSC